MTVAKNNTARRELPKGWRTEKLGKLCLQDRRIIEPGTNKSAELPYLSLEHIESNTGRILREPSEIVEDEGKSMTFAFDYRHILYGKLRPYLNKVALPSFTGRCTTEAIPLLPHDGVDRHFLAWLLRRQETVDAAMREKTGSRMPRADMEDLLNLEVPVPPLPEQRRIAMLLGEQMAVVERARAAAGARLAAARALPAAYLREAFCGITPLAARKERDQAPPGWKWHRLKDLARLESGHTPSRRRPEWWGGDIPWIALPDIRALDGKIAEQTSEYTNEQGIANSAARVLPAGTVVLSRTASVGFVTVMGRPMATSQDFVNWVCGPQLEPHFLAYLLRAARTYIRALGEGAVHKTVYFPTVEAFEVCIPQLAEQKQIVASLDHTLLAVEQGFTTLQAQLASIESLPAALLRQAFSGEL